MRLFVVAMIAIGALTAVVRASRRRREARREDVSHQLFLAENPERTTTLVYADDPDAAWLGSRPSTRNRVHRAMSMELALADVVGIEPPARVVLCLGERDLRDGTPIADIVGDLARLHDHLDENSVPMVVVATPRPRGRFGGAVDSLNAEIERVCRERGITFWRFSDVAQLEVFLDSPSPSPE